MRFRYAIERIGLPDLDLHVAALDAREQLSAAFLEVGALADEVEQGRPRHVQRPALRQLEQRERLDGTGRVAEADHHAMPTQTIERLIERCPADRSEEHTSELQSREKHV